MRYSLEQTEKICKGNLYGKDNIFQTVITDSRGFNYRKESLFIAIKGANHNGHNHIGEMYRKGIRSFIIEQEIDYSKYPDAGFVLCSDSVKALQLLAADYRSSFTGMVVAITGSNGKTVTKEWIAQLAPDNIKIFRSPRSYNSQIGVPLSILMMEGDEQIAVIEAGISKQGEMERLERVIRPDIGIITNIGDAHQENFSSVEEKLGEKMKLFTGCGKVIKGWDIPALKYDLSGFPFKDKASIQDISLALELYETLGYNITEISKKLPSIQPVAMRLELKEGIGASKLINDSYNSDINSLSIALNYLDNIAADGKKMVILSDISQSGLPSTELYAKVASMIEDNKTDLFIGIGQELSNNGNLFKCEAYFYNTTDEFLAGFNRTALNNATVLIKGGRVFGFEKISHALELKTHTTVLEVNLDNMIHNLNYFRSKLGGNTKLMAMVKALSYGSGSFEVASMLQHQKVDYLAVAFADEGVTLRQAGIVMPIVVLNADADSFELMIEHSLEPEIYSLSSLRSFTDAVKRHGGRKYPIHIKLDTGMHRLGFTQNDIAELISTLKNNDAVVVCSIFSHLAGSDESHHDEFTRSQISLFDSMSRKITEAFADQKIIRHISNSAAIERFPEAQFDMVRLGIGLYGIGVECQDQLLPVSTLKSRIVQIKNIPQGETIGYGRHAIALTEIKTATIPIGYADGMDRHLSRGKWSIMVNGHKAPIIGNICMDTCMIDITGIEAKEGDSVIIFGASEQSVSEMARVLETIPYEIMTSISSRVKRIYIKE